MIVTIDVLVGILVLAGLAMLFWVVAWVLKLLGVVFRYVALYSGIAKIKGWLSSTGWLSELADILLLVIILAVALTILFVLGQAFTGKPYIG